MLTRKRLLQKRDRIRDRTFRKDLKRNVHRLYNKVIENTRKGQHSNNKELRIRNDIL